MFSSLLFASFGCLGAPTVSSGASDNGVETNNPALSLTELWNFTVFNYTANTVWLHWETPLVVDGMAYLRTTETYTIPGERYVPLLNIPITHYLGTVYALNNSNGVKLWNLTANGDHYSLNIIDGVAYVSATDSMNHNGKYGGGNIFALDAVNGHQKWVFQIDGRVLWTRIIDGVIYFFFHASGFNSYVYAVKASNGEELWRYDAGYYAWLSPPAFGDNAIYFGTSKGFSNNHYYALSTVNGSELWSFAVDGRVSGYSAIFDDTVYFSSDDSTYALNARTGEKRWSYPAAEYYIGVDGMACVRDGDNIYAFDASSRNKVWSFSANETIISSLSLVDNVIYFCTNGTLNALNPSNGARLWNCSIDYNKGFMIIDFTSPYYFLYHTNATVNDGVLYYFSGKTLYALDTSNGNSLWNYTTDSNRSFLTVTNNTAYFCAGNTVYALSVPTVVHSPEPFPTTLVATVSGALIAIISMGLLVYFKKRKKS
jgi:outer membrane protein assembly factor BamB